MVQLSDQFGSPRMTKGGQGKLFSEPKPTDQHRYQRGYTPERMAAVRGSMIDFETVKAGPNDSPATRYAVGQTHQSARRMADVVARSTADMHHYGQGSVDVAARRTHMTNRVNPSDMWSLHVSTGDHLPGAAGTYSGGGTWDRGQIRIEGRGDEEAHGQTLMHEMGHYISHKINPSDSNDYNTPTRVGREEAHADDYMMTHWRPDPRDVRRGTSAKPRPVYENSDAFYGNGRKKAHGPYLTARTTLNPDQKKTIRRVGYSPGVRTSKPFTHEATGDRWSPTGLSGWNTQGALFNDRRE